MATLQRALSKRRADRRGAWSSLEERDEQLNQPNSQTCMFCGLLCGLPVDQSASNILQCKSKAQLLCFFNLLLNCEMDEKKQKRGRDWHKILKYGCYTSNAFVALLLWYVIYTAAAHHLGRYEPSFPSRKELRGYWVQYLRNWSTIASFFAILIKISFFKFVTWDESKY